MDVYISHHSALQFWRSHAFDAFSMTRTRIKSVEYSLSSKLGLAGLGLPALGFSFDSQRPLDVMVSSDHAYRKCKEIRTHICAGPLPIGSFVRIAPGVLVCSPELCLLQTSLDMDLVQTVQYGYELSGSYSTITANSTKGPDNDGKGFVELTPRTNRKRLVSFVSEMLEAPRCQPGTNRIARALKYIQSGSASPAETALSMKLVLPYRAGGFSLPLPLLNHTVYLDKRIFQYAKTYAGTHAETHVKETVIDEAPLASSNEQSLHWSPCNVPDPLKLTCDLFWTDAKLCLEYDSDMFHVGRERITRDAIRRERLMRMGIEVITVTRPQLHSITEFDSLANLVAKKLGRRIRTSRKDHQDLQLELNAKLFPYLRY